MIVDQIDFGINVIISDFNTIQALVNNEDIFDWLSGKEATFLTAIYQAIEEYNHV